ncbi:MAG: CD225/dispanin family protein [Armatimonadota bacterium]|nr:CD225/dispanin family protein [Armatimonadota bacterium]
MTTRAEARIPCPNCGESLAIRYGYCPKCGQIMRPPAPKNYLIECILATLFCCFPLSIVGLFYSLAIDQHHQRGDHDRAAKASNLARKWLVGSVVLGLAVYLGVVIWGLIWLMEYEEPISDDVYLTSADASAQWSPSNNCREEWEWGVLARVAGYRISRRRGSARDAAPTLVGSRRLHRHRVDSATGHKVLHRQRTI